MLSAEELTGVAIDLTHLQRVAGWCSATMVRRDVSSVIDEEALPAQRALQAVEDAAREAAQRSARDERPTHAWPHREASWSLSSKRPTRVGRSGPHWVGR